MYVFFMVDGDCKLLWRSDMMAYAYNPNYLGA